VVTMPNATSVASAKWSRVMDVREVDDESVPRVAVAARFYCAPVVAIRYLRAR
jgi:hypothetical protein